jgi:hypothetical protein
MLVHRATFAALPALREYGNEWNSQGHPLHPEKNSVGTSFRCPCGFDPGARYWRKHIHVWRDQRGLTQTHSVR